MPRPEFITASSFDDLMTNGRGTNTLGATAISECKRIALRWHGVQDEGVETWEMRWGNENEPYAREAYEALNLTSIVKPDFQVSPDMPDVGGTCDGLVGSVGMVEIKCPNTANHLENILTGAQLSKYEWQIQGYLWIYDRKWCDFISFDPRMPIPETQIHVIRVVREEARIQALKNRINECRPIIQQVYDMLEAKRQK